MFIWKVDSSSMIQKQEEVIRGLKSIRCKFETRLAVRSNSNLKSSWGRKNKHFERLKVRKFLPKPELLSSHSEVCSPWRACCSALSASPFDLYQPKLWLPTLHGFLLLFHKSLSVVLAILSSCGVGCWSTSDGNGWAICPWATAAVEPTLGHEICQLHLLFCLFSHTEETLLR